MTAVRGALEILRDFTDLIPADRQRFVNTALEECARLETGIEQLASTVYAAGQRDHLEIPASVKPKNYDYYASRIKILDEHDAIEVDFSDFEFSSSKIVNDFYDVLDKLIKASGRSWYIIVNYRDVSIWPEAWVAFAHRGKKLKRVIRWARYTMWRMKKTMITLKQLITRAVPILICLHPVVPRSPISIPCARVPGNSGIALPWNTVGIDCVYSKKSLSDFDYNLS